MLCPYRISVFHHDICRETALPCPEFGFIAIKIGTQQCCVPKESEIMFVGKRHCRVLTWRSLNQI